jgi:hypothetical protein
MKPTKDNFSYQAKAYAQFRPHYPKALFDFLLANVKQRDSAWDVGTGNGQVASVLAGEFLKVYATDISQKQLQEATEKVNIDYYVRRAEESGFPDHTFDLICVAQALHWFDIPAFFAEAKRVAREGCLLATWGYGLVSVNEEIDKLILNFYGNVIGPYWDAERILIDEEYRNVNYPLDEIAVPRFTIELHWTLEQLMGYFSSWSAVQNYYLTNKKDPLEAFNAELDKAWGEKNTRVIRFPVFMRAGYL